MPVLPDKLPKQIIQKSFPFLDNHNHSITSPIDNHYNCIAWAVGDNSSWWDPNGYWPDNVPTEYSLSAYIMAYETKGYSLCDDGLLEPGYSKVAIFTRDGSQFSEPLHAAKQRWDGTWSSKLGQSYDITHLTVDGIEGPEYGKRAVFMKKINT